MIDTGLIVQALLDNDDVYSRVISSAIDPGTHVESALVANSPVDLKFPGRHPWAFDLEIKVPVNITPNSKLRQIRLKWQRPENYEGIAPHMHRGGGYAAYKVGRAKEIGAAIRKIVKQARTPSASDYSMNLAFRELEVLQWITKKGKSFSKRT